MGSQTEVNNNQVLGVDDYESSQEMLRTSLVVNIEKRGFEEEQGGEDLEAVNLAMVAVQENEGKVDKIGTASSMEEVDMNKTDLVEDVKTERNLKDKGRGNDSGGTDEVESVLFEETKTEGNFIEKRRAVMSEVTDESVLNKKLDVADDLSTDDTVSVLELDVTAMKNFEEKEDEVSRLLFALRALCTSDNTDVVLLCGAWQMRAHSQVLRARSRTLGELLGSTIDLPTKSITKLRLNMDPGALGIAVNYMYFNEFGNWDGGTALEKVVEAASELRVPGLLQACVPILDRVGLVDAFKVLLVAEATGLEELVEAAVRRVNREKGTLVRDPMFRESLVHQPTVLLRLYQELAIEKEHMEEEQLTNFGARRGDLRACYGCGACSTGDYCSWCNYRPASSR